MEHPGVRSEYTAAPWKRDRSRRDGSPWQPDPLWSKGTGLPHHRRAGLPRRISKLGSIVDKSTRIFPIIVQKPHLLLSIWLACVRLYHVLYENVNESIYLMRKHTRFKQIAETFESSLSQE